MFKILLERHPRNSPIGKGTEDLGVCLGRGTYISVILNFNTFEMFNHLYACLVVICWLQAASMLILKLAYVKIQLDTIMYVKIFCKLKRIYKCTIQEDFLLPQHLLPGAKLNKQNSSIDISWWIKNSVLKCKYPPKIFSSASQNFLPNCP